MISFIVDPTLYSLPYHQLGWGWGGEAKNPWLKDKLIPKDLRLTRESKISSHSLQAREDINWEVMQAFRWHGNCRRAEVTTLFTRAREWGKWHLLPELLPSGAADCRQGPTQMGHMDYQQLRALNFSCAQGNWESPQPVRKHHCCDTISWDSMKETLYK